MFYVFYCKIFDNNGYFGSYSGISVIQVILVNRHTGKFIHAANIISTPRND